jgi:hypothetical protein
MAKISTKNMVIISTKNGPTVIPPPLKNALLLK